MNEAITSRRNPLILELGRLHQRREREQTGRFLIEGATEIAEAARHGVALDLLLIGTGDARGALPGVPPAVRRIVLAPEVFAKLSLRENPDGFLAVGRSGTESLADWGLSPGGVVVCLDGVEKPGNLGAIARTARAAGVWGMLATGRGADLVNPQAIRASRGHLFGLRRAVCSADEAIAWARAAGLCIAVAAPGGAVCYWEADLSRPLLLVLGEEASGVGEAWMEAADLRLAIPMVQAMDSLNVSVSGALILYEALRQRSVGLGGGASV